MQGDYNRGDSYGSPVEPPPNSQLGDYGGFTGGNYQQQQQYNSGMMGQPPPQQQQPGYSNQPHNPYYGQQPSSFYNRPTGIGGSPAQSTPAIPALSDEDIKIFKETQKNVIFKRFFPAAVIGCGAIYMAHQKKFFKPSVWTYGIYLCTASYITQFSARNELRIRVAESSSMSPFAQQVRMQLGYVNKQNDNTFSDDSSDFNYYNTPTTGTQYSPYNRFNRQRQSKDPSEFTDESVADEKDLTEFSSDVKSIQSRGSAEFTPDDIVAADSGFRTRRVADQTDKAEKSRLTYEELRMRNRAQYQSMPSPGNSPYTQPMNSDNPEMYNRPGSF